MPVVPTRSAVPSVSSAPLPGIRVPQGAPREAFQPPALPNLSGVTEQVRGLYQQARSHADQVATLDAMNQLTRFRGELLNDPTKGILSARGKNALDASDGWVSKWQEGVSNIRQGLTTDQQREMFDRIAQGEYGRATEEVETHVAAQMHQYDQETTSSALDLLYTDAVQHASDPKAVADAIAKGRAIAADWGQRQGMPPEQVQQTIQTLTSKAHVGVIDALINRGEDVTAAEYFAKHQSELSGNDLAQTEKVVQAGSLRAASQQRADAIMQSAASLGSALEQTKQITDPNLRDAVETRIRRNFQDKDAADRQAEDDRFQRLSDALRQNGGDFDRLSRADVLALSPAHYDHLKNQADEIRYPKVHTNQSVYADLVNQAGLNDATRAGFAQLDLTQPKYRQSLSDSDYQSILGLQRVVRDQLRRTSVTTDARVRRKEEASVTKAADQNASVNQILNSDLFTNQSPQVKQLLQSRLKRVQIPQWMVDSAKVDEDYADYLRMHGIDVDSASTPSTPAAAPQKAPVPGAPISRAPLNLSTP